MKLSGLLSTTVVLSVIIHSVSAQDHDHAYEQHASHVHGTAELQLAVDAHEMEIRFQSPAMNLVGFEQKPRSFQQLQQLASAENILGQPQQLFIFSAEADCTLNTVDVHAPFEDEHEHSEEEHADFASHYHYRCNDTTKLSGLKVTLFEYFPLIEQIRVQVLSEKGQLAFDLLRGSYIIDL